MRMQKKLAIASLALALGFGARAARADQHLAGSDTLHDFTVQMLTDCPNTGKGNGTGDLIYDGGGSGNGETAMVTGANPANQFVAPMSRNLKTAAVTGGQCASGGSAQGLNMGLDGVSVVRDEDTIAGCDTLAYSTTITVNDENGVAGLQCPGCINTNQYKFQDWRDVLRVLYGGFTHDTLPSSDNPYDPCKKLEPGRSAFGTGNVNQQCNSDVRNSLVNHWGNLFQGTCGTEKCTQLKHAFRRDDSSGTTDVFTVLLSLPSQGKPNDASPSPYCSGHNQHDDDPIRRSCDGNGNTAGENVCQPRNAKAKPYLEGGGSTDDTTLDLTNTPQYDPAVAHTGDLGVVQVVLVPEGVSTTISHNVTPCDFGSFDLADNTVAMQLSGARCPDGTPQILNKCFVPQDASGNFGCLNFAANTPPIGNLKTIDGRAYNLILRTGNNNSTSIVKDTNNNPVTMAIYRLHETQVMAGASKGTTPAVTCREDDSTSQIGCMVQASPCSIGYAGREAANKTTIANDDVRSLFVSRADVSGVTDPNDTDVRLLLSNTCTLNGSGTYAQRYPISRRLWLNTLVGFSSSSIPTTQKTLATCWADRYYSDNLISKFGFITLDGDPNHCSKADPSNSGPGRGVCQLAPVGSTVVCQ